MTETEDNASKLSDGYKVGAIAFLVLAAILTIMLTISIQYSKYLEHQTELRDKTLSEYRSAISTMVDQYCVSTGFEDGGWYWSQDFNASI